MSNNAILIVGKPANGVTPMVMGIPAGGTYAWYSRDYTGQRGRGAAWLYYRMEQATNADTPAHAPISVPLTDRDIALSAAGSITSANTKVMKAYNDIVDSVDAYNQWGYSGKTIIQEVREIMGESAKAPIPDAAPVATPAPVADAALLTVPEAKWANDYINRKVQGEVTDFDILDTAMSAHQNVLISGPAGSGKTVCAMAYAASRGYNYYNISSHSGVEHSQLLGRWVPTEDGSFRFQYGPVAEIVRDGGVLLINEVNFMPQAVKTVLFSLLDHRREIQILDNRGEVIKAHPNLLVIADMNPGYRGTKPLNEAEKDRYAHKLEFPYDPVIEGKLVHSKALLNLANKLRDSFDREELMTPVSTRSLIAFQDNIYSLGIDYAIYSFLNGFEDNERNAVRMAVDTVKSNIMEDFGLNTNITLNADEVGN